jgi:hypothetical protein
MDNRRNEQRARGVLLSFPRVRTHDSQSSPECDECKRLEREYRLAIDAIYAVVNGRFENVREKLKRLFEGQESRDKALTEFYAHKKSHTRRAA